MMNPAPKTYCASSLLDPKSNGFAAIVAALSLYDWVEVEDNHPRFKNGHWSILKRDDGQFGLKDGPLAPDWGYTTPEAVVGDLQDLVAERRDNIRCIRRRFGG